MGPFSKLGPFNDLPRSPVAQLVEQWTVNPCVPGSSPGGGALKEPVFCCFCIEHGLFRALFGLVKLASRLQLAANRRNRWCVVNTNFAAASGTIDFDT